VKTLISLDDHNLQAGEARRKSRTYPQPNGIACPKCGSELNDLNAALLASNPPQKNVGCPSCGYRGYRVA